MSPKVTLVSYRDLVNPTTGSQCGGCASGYDSMIRDRTLITIPLLCSSG